MACDRFEIPVQREELTAMSDRSGRNLAVSRRRRDSHSSTSPPHSSGGYVVGPVELKQGERLEALLDLAECLVAAKPLQHLLKDEPSQNHVGLAHKAGETTDRGVSGVASRA